MTFTTTELAVNIERLAPTLSTKATTNALCRKLGIAHKDTTLVHEGHTSMRFVPKRKK